MKTTKLNDEKAIVILTKGEIITICTGLLSYASELLKEDKYEAYSRVKEMYNSLFEYQL